MQRRFRHLRLPQPRLSLFSLGQRDMNVAVLRELIFEIRRKGLAP
jgi:hypothetical protein